MDKKILFKVVGLMAGGVLAVGVAVAPSAYAADQSGCVTCHTDEAKLTANLAKVEVKTSAMQAGQG